MAVTSRKFELLFSAKNKATATIEQVGAQLKKTGDRVDAINSKFNLLLGAAITQRVKDFVLATVDANDALNDMADRTGLSVESLSKLSEVAKAGDTSVETLTKAFNKLNLQAVEAPGVFESLGINVLDTAGKMKDSEALFNEVADRIASIENPARRAAVATQVFGKAGLELMPILKNGSAGIKGWTNDAERLGAVTSTTLAAASGEFNDNIQRMQMAAKGFSNVVSGELLPGLNLMASGLIEIAAESIGFSKGNADSKKSIEDLAKSKGFDDLRSAIGFIGDAMQDLTATGKVSVGFVRGYVGQVVNLFVAAKEMATTLNNENGLNQLAAVQEAWRKQQEEIKKEFDATWDNTYQQERFSDRLTRGLQKAVANAKEAADEASASAKENTAEVAKLGTVSLAQAVRVTNGAEAQITALAKVTDEASAKSKKALTDQKKVADEFQAIAKQLKRATPAGGTLDQNLAKAAKNEEARAKINAANERLRSAAEQTASTERLERLHREAEAARTAYEAEDSLWNKARRAKAAAAVQTEITAQAQNAALAEQRALMQETAKEEVSYDKRLEIRAAAVNELNDIYLQIKQNAKTGDENGEELARLKRLGEELQKNKDAANGVFTQGEIDNYAKEIEALANSAAKADAEAAKKAEDTVLASAKERFQELQAELLKVKFGFDDESIVAEATKALELIQSKLKGIVLPVTLAMPEEYKTQFELEAGATPIKRANGGIVRGPGTGTSDSIPALLSDGEFVIRSRVMKKRGMLALANYINNDGDISLLFGRRFANGGSVSNSKMSAPPATNLSIDLRTNAGNIKVNAGTSQSDLDAALRKQKLRHS